MSAFPFLVSSTLGARILVRVALVVMTFSCLTACNQEPGDSAPSEVPASAPMGSSAAS